LGRPWALPLILMLREKHSASLSTSSPGGCRQSATLKRRGDFRKPWLYAYRPRCEAFSGGAKRRCYAKRRGLIVLTPAMPNSRHSSSALGTNWLHCSYRRRRQCAYKWRCEDSLQGARLGRRGRSFVRQRSDGAGATTGGRRGPSDGGSDGSTTSVGSARIPHEVPGGASSITLPTRGRQGWRGHCRARRRDSQKRRGRTQATAAWSSVAAVATVPGMLRHPSHLFAGADQRAVWSALVGCQSFVAVHKRPKIVLFLWDPGSMKLDACLLHGNYGGQLR
jgi:hypothetical protein